MQRLLSLLVIWTIVFGSTPALSLTVNGQLKGAILEKSASDLSNWEGRVYWNTATKKAKVYNGTTWTSLGAGGGSGEINLVGSPSEAIGWTETGTVFDSGISTTSTTSDLPLSGVTDTAIKITATDSGTEASNYVSYAFTTPASLSGKMKVQFYLRPGTGFAADEWTTSIYQSSTRKSLSSDAPGTSISYLPNLSGKYTSTVDLEASTAYTMRFARTSGAGSATLNVASVIVGPGIGAQGAVVTEWQTYVPTITGNGNKTFNQTFTGRWRRVGDSMELMVAIYDNTSIAAGAGSTSIAVSIPSGYTMDLEKVATNSGTIVSDQALVGYGVTWGITASGSYDYGVGVIPASATTLGWSKAGSSSARLSTSDINVARSVQLVLHAMVPIEEWEGAGTVNLVQSEKMGNPFVYEFSSWNPSGTGETFTDPTAGSVTSDNPTIAASGPSSGTATFTFSQTGFYNIALSVGHNHSNAYSFAGFIVTLGGTASRLGNLGNVSWAYSDEATDASDSVTNQIIVQVTESGQTFTFRPKYHSNGISVATQHSAYASVMITPLSGLGQAYGFAEATSSALGLVRANRYLQKESSTTYTSTDNGSTVLVVNNVPAGTYRVTVGVWFVFQLADTAAYVKPRVNNSYISIGGSDWAIGPPTTGSMSGEAQSSQGISSTRIVTFPNATNQFELQLTITGSSGLQRPWYILEKLENVEAITTEWD